ESQPLATRAGKRTLTGPGNLVGRWFADGGSSQARSFGAALRLVVSGAQPPQADLRPPASRWRTAQARTPRRPPRAPYGVDRSLTGSKSPSPRSLAPEE